MGPHPPAGVCFLARPQGLIAIDKIGSRALSPDLAYDNGSHSRYFL